jgi:hypothetical protein
MSSDLASKASRRRKVLGITLLALFGLYVSSYLILSRLWRSDLEASLGPNRIEGVTCYVPLQVLGTPKGYGLHCFLCGFYDPLWRLDRMMGGPTPISINQGIGEKKR